MKKFLAVTLLVLAGCAQTQTFEEREAAANVKAQSYVAPQIREIWYKHHLYLVFVRHREFGLTHAAHCPGDHDEQ